MTSRESRIRALAYTISLHRRADRLSFSPSACLVEAALHVDAIDALPVPGELAEGDKCLACHGNGSLMGQFCIACRGTGKVSE